MALPLGGTLMMDEDAASIVAQIRNLFGQLRNKGVTYKMINTILTQQKKPGRAYINSRGKLVLPDENDISGSENSRPISILKEDHLLNIIRKFQQILIETVKIRFEQPVV